MNPRILLLLPTTTYKATPMLEAAEALGVDVVVGSERRQALESSAPGHTLTLDFARPERSLAGIAEQHAQRPFRAIVGVDDETTLLAAVAARALGLPHNPVEAVRAAGDKLAFRRRLREAGMYGPSYRKVSVEEQPSRIAADFRYPCVVKPLGLSASRGVLRADDPASFVAAFTRVKTILSDPALRGKGMDREHVLVEDYLAGPEFAVEGLLEAGELRVLALFDKPDPLEGPTFEETIYVTPSRRESAVRERLIDEARRGCRALGLEEGPVHGELRLHQDRPWLIELAPRTIGGQCARVLRFGTGISLEELVLRRALGLDTAAPRESRAAGVMMIPIPRPGVLRGVRGVDRARAVPGIEDVSITLHAGSRVVPLPEGDRYLGFLFARADAPQTVERALREAHARLAFEIDGYLAGS